MTNSLPGSLRMPWAPRRPPRRMMRKPVLPTLNLSDNINGNLVALLLLGDTISGPPRMLSPYPSVFATGNPGNPVLNNFTSGSIAANDTGGTCLQFNGSNTFIDLGTGYWTVLGAGPWSAYIRFYMTAFGSNYLMYEPASGFNNFAWLIPSSAGGTMGFNLGTNAGGINSAKNSWSLNIWYDAIITYNGSRFVIYINGAFDSDNAWSTNPGAANMNTQMGRFAFPPGPTNGGYLNGRIDQMRIWKPRLLGAADAARLWAEPYSGLLDASITPRRGVPLFVRGVVTEVGLPVAKIVRAYDSNTGALINSTTSSGVDGTYAMDVGTRSQVYVAAFDPTSYKAQVFDRVTPVP